MYKKEGQKEDCKDSRVGEKQLPGEAGDTTESKFSVLIVDDESEIREFLADYMLEKGDYSISEAGSLGETKKYFDKGKSFDIVVLDLIMPDSKGLEALEALLAYQSKTPIFVLTGYPGLEKSTLALGAKYHMEKPFSPHEVENVIRQKFVN